MSFIVRLTEVRVTRAACALVELQHAIERTWASKEEHRTEEQLENLCILRELVISQIEQLSPRIRRNHALRTAMDVTCHAYRAWLDSGVDAAKRNADVLSMRIDELAALVRTNGRHPSGTVLLSEIR